MPRMLYTYLVNQVLVPFYASLVLLTSILFISKIIPVLDLILDYNISFADFIRLYAYLTPQLLLFTLPMASMMGVVLGTVRLANDREIMIMKSCGISFYQMLPPIVTVALCVSLLSGLVSVYLIPKGNTAKAELLLRLARERIEDSIQEKKFSEGLGNVVLYVDEVDEKNNRWQGIYISDMREKHNPVVVVARAGTITNSPEQGAVTLNLQEGSLHRSQGESEESIHFQRYTFNLPTIEPARNSLAKAGRTAMTQSQLLKQADILGRNTKAGAQLLDEFHMRLAIPVGCFILTVLGLPLGLLSGPGQRAVGVPLGLFVLIFYHILLIAGDAIGKTTIAPPGVPLWLPNVIFSIITILLIRGTAKESYTGHLDRMFSFGHRVAVKLNWHGRK